MFQGLKKPPLVAVAALVVVAAGNTMWSAHVHWRTLRGMILWGACVLILAARTRLAMQVMAARSAVQSDRSRASEFQSQPGPLTRAQLIGAAEAEIEARQASLENFDQAEFQRLTTVLREELGDAKFEALAAEGRAMTVERAISFALERNNR